MAGEDPDRTLHEISEAMAPGWERWRERLDGTMTPVRRWLVAAPAFSLGGTVLEVAAAAVDTGFGAARMVGERGRLISTDLMVAVGRRRVAAVGVTNAEHLVMDARHLDLPDSSVDGVPPRSRHCCGPTPRPGSPSRGGCCARVDTSALAVWAAAEPNP